MHSPLKTSREYKNFIKQYFIQTVSAHAKSSQFITTPWNPAIGMNEKRRVITRDFGTQ